jgi:hypothetical protein
MGCFEFRKLATIDVTVYGAQTQSCSRYALVLVEQPARAVPPSHLDRLTNRFGLDWQRTILWDKTQASVRSTAVVMLDEHLDRVLKNTLTVC